MREFTGPTLARDATRMLWSVTVLGLVLTVYWRLFWRWRIAPSP